MRNIIIFLIGGILLSVTFAFADFQQNKMDADNSEKASNALKGAAGLAISWLENQVVPCDLLRNPVEQRKGLVLSYRTDPANALFGKSSIYDNALAVIAFSLYGKTGKAADIIRAVNKNSEKGILYFFYNLHDGWPAVSGEDGAVFRTGAAAWFAYSIVFYLELALNENPAYCKDPEFNEFLNFSNLITENIILYRINDSDKAGYGLFTGGSNTTLMQFDAEHNKITELYKTGKIEWVSTEHNIDVFFLLRGMFRLAGGKKYAEYSIALRESMIKRLWNSTLCQFNAGMSGNKPDTTEALDCASWGSIFLNAAGEKGKALYALDSASRYVKIHGSITGYSPYRNSAIYENSMINERSKAKNWNEINMIWPEGSLGVAMACIKTGRKDTALSIMENMIKLQDAGGGIPYSTEDIPYQFSTEPSAASAAWLAICVSAFYDDSVRDLFWGN